MSGLSELPGLDVISEEMAIFYSQPISGKEDSISRLLISGRDTPIMLCMLPYILAVLVIPFYLLLDEKPPCGRTAPDMKIDNFAKNQD